MVIARDGFFLSHPHKFSSSPPKPLVQIQSNFTELFLMIPSTKMCGHLLVASVSNKHRNLMCWPIYTFQAKTNGRAVSEGREISPTRQHKIDELWDSSTQSKDSAIGKRSNMMTKSSVSRSMDLDDSHMDSPSAKGWLKCAVPHCHRSTLPVVNFFLK